MEWRESIEASDMNFSLENIESYLYIAKAKAKAKRWKLKP